MIITLSGHTCAGKTTGAQVLSRAHGFQTIEASDFMLRMYQTSNNTDISIDEFAARALADDPRIVARQVAGEMSTHFENLVISGFRGYSEIKYIRKAYPERNILSLFIVASQKKRADRCFRRNRIGGPTTLSEFKKIDRLQFDMGLNEIRTNNSVRKMYNSSSIDDYSNKLLKILPIVLRRGP